MALTSSAEAWFRTTATNVLNLLKTNGQQSKMASSEFQSLLDNSQRELSSLSTQDAAPFYDRLIGAIRWDSQAAQANYQQDYGQATSRVLKGSVLSVGETTYRAKTADLNQDALLSRTELITAEADLHASIDALKTWLSDGRAEQLPVGKARQAEIREVLTERLHSLQTQAEELHLLKRSFGELAAHYGGGATISIDALAEAAAISRSQSIVVRNPLNSKEARTAVLVLQDLTTKEPIYFSKMELATLYDSLLKADTNQDGLVNKTELKNYKAMLKSRVEDRQKMLIYTTVEKALMDGGGRKGSQIQEGLNKLQDEIKLIGKVQNSSMFSSAVSMEGQIDIASIGRLAGMEMPT